MLGHWKAKVMQNSMDVFYESLLAKNKLFLEVKLGYGTYFIKDFVSLFHSTNKNRVLVAHPFSTHL